MTKLGLQNEQQKEHSKILEYIERQKEICRQNPKHRNCSKPKVCLISNQMPLARKEYPYLYFDSNIYSFVSFE